MAGASTENPMSRPTRAPPPEERTAVKRPPSRAAIRRELRRLARELADTLVDMLDGSGVWSDGRVDHLNGDAGAKRVRRTAEALDKVMARIVADLRTRKEAVAIGTVAATLGMTSRQIAHPMSLLVDEGKVIRTGERRGARYRLAPPPKRRRPASTTRTPKKKKRRRG